MVKYQEASYVGITQEVASLAEETLIPSLYFTTSLIELQVPG